MTELDRYLDAATRQNTVRSYASALRHFEVEWQGHLPATPDSVARYLAAYAQTLATSTLRQRLAAIASWHRDHGFVDPTRSPLVRKVLKGIQTLHPGQIKKAAPLQIRRLVEEKRVRFTSLSNLAVHASGRGWHDEFRFVLPHLTKADVAGPGSGVWRRAALKACAP